MKATANAMRAARRLRREMSLPEAVLWRLLRRSPGGVRFRRQHAIGPYVADFYCPAAKLVIEIDSRAHDLRASRDEVRDTWMRSEGLEILRISAVDVLRDPVGVADGLISLCAVGPSPSGFAGWSPSPS